MTAPGDAPRLYDVVRVAACDAGRPIDLGHRHPAVGDRGTVVHVHDVKNGQDRAYIVECVEADGSTAWLAEFACSELQLETPAP